MDRFGADVALAIAVAAWFVATGIAKVAARPATGRRSVVLEPGWQVVVRRARGVLEILGGLAATAGGAISLLGLPIGFPGRALGFVLCGLAAWTVVELVRMPLRTVRVALALLGFVLAAFYAGFRG